MPSDLAECSVAVSRSSRQRGPHGRTGVVVVRDADAVERCASLKQTIGGNGGNTREVETPRGAIFIDANDGGPGAPLRSQGRGRSTRGARDRCNLQAGSLRPVKKGIPWSVSQ
jgi:hypothetical protein